MIQGFKAGTAVRVAASLLLVGIIFFQSSWFFLAMCLMAAAMVSAAWSGRRRDWLVWIGMLVGFALFADLRARMGPWVEPHTFFSYAVRLETLGGLVAVPSVWLQDNVARSFLNWGGVLDVLSTVVYVSFFIVPQVVVVYLWRKDREFGRYVVAACFLFGVALVFHYLLPTAPPWMAADRGVIPPVDRIGVQVLARISPSLTESGYQASANDVAAMPSVHLGLTVLASLALARVNPHTRWVAWAYSLAMLFTITYLGEHYVVDGVAGAAVAWGAWMGAGALLPDRGGETEGRRGAGEASP